MVDLVDYVENMKTGFIHTLNLLTEQTSDTGDVSKVKDYRMREAGKLLLARMTEKPLAALPEVFADAASQGFIDVELKATLQLALQSWLRVSEVSEKKEANPWALWPVNVAMREAMRLGYIAFYLKANPGFPQTEDTKIQHSDIGTHNLKVAAIPIVQDHIIECYGPGYIQTTPAHFDHEVVSRRMLNFLQTPDGGAWTGQQLDALMAIVDRYNAERGKVSQPATKLDISRARVTIPHLPDPVPRELFRTDKGNSWTSERLSGLGELLFRSGAFSKQPALHKRVSPSRLMDPQAADYQVFECLQAAEVVVCVRKKIEALKAVVDKYTAEREVFQKGGPWPTFPRPKLSKQTQKALEACLNLQLAEREISEACLLLFSLWGDESLGPQKPGQQKDEKLHAAEGFIADIFKMEMAFRLARKCQQDLNPVKKEGSGEPLPKASVSRAESFDAQAAGRQAVEKLQAAEGGAWTGQELNALFKLTSATLHKRRTEHRIIYWRDARHNFHYPKWQFNAAGALLPGIQEVLEQFKSQDEWRVMSYFLGKRAQLSDERPLDLLRQGDVARVLEHAENHAQENTW